jgi:hypothetical protein
MEGFYISGVVLSCSATKGQLVSTMDLSEIGYEEEKWMELAQDRVQWRALVLAVLNLLVLLPES